MRSRICLILLLLTSLHTWPQAAPSATGYGGNTADEGPMQTPPPVSGEAYATAIDDETRSNHVSAGFSFAPAYNSNLLQVTSSAPVSDVSYSIWSTISLDQTTPRIHQTFTYNPGFTLFQHASSGNEQTQNLSFDSQYGLGPHLTLSVQDQFQKTSNVLNSSNPLSEITVPGSAQSPIVPVVAPFADQLSNTASSVLTYQFNRNDMVGGSGVFYYLHYANPEQVSGLYDSNSLGGSSFYNHRLSAGQYLGVTYQFTATSDNPQTSQNTIRSETQTHSASVFYTIYLQPQLSLSFSAGPQHYDVTQSPLPDSHGWVPALMASMGWQERHIALAASYSREVGGGGGLTGAYHTNAAIVSFQWQAERTWAVGVAGNYFLTSNVGSAMAALNSGGSSVSGTFVIHHTITEHIYLDFGYSRLHQNYENVPAISNVPNSDRIYASISYQLTRPLGR